MFTACSKLVHTCLPVVVLVLVKPFVVLGILALQLGHASKCQGRSIHMCTSQLRKILDSGQRCVCCLLRMDESCATAGLRIIPCVGSCLEDMLEGLALMRRASCEALQLLCKPGVVDTVLCVVSCAFGCSCGLLVLGIVWLVMRPLPSTWLPLILHLNVPGLPCNYANMLK